MKRRIFAGLLVFALVCSSLPGMALAADPATSPQVIDKVIYTKVTDHWEVTGYEEGANGFITIRETFNTAEKVTAIADGAFENANISGALIPKSIAKIGSKAFSGSKVSTIIIDEAASGVEVGSYAFSSSSIQNFVGNASKIGKGAFDACASLTTVIIPSGLTSIEDIAFSGCGKLSDVFLGSSTTAISKDNIGSNIFAGDSLLKIIHFDGGFSTSVRTIILNTAPGGAARVEGHEGASVSFKFTAPDGCKKDGSVEATIRCNKMVGSGDNAKPCSSPVITRTFQAVQHTPEVIPAVAATCQKEGSTEGSKCSVCEKILTPSAVVPKIPHKYEGVDTVAGWLTILEASCTNDTVQIQGHICTNEIPDDTAAGKHECGEAEVLTEEQKETLAQAFLAYNAAEKEEDKKAPLEALKELGYVKEENNKAEPKDIKIVENSQLPHTADLTAPFERVESFDTGDCKTGGKGTVIFKCTECGEEFEVSNYDIEAGIHAPVAEDKLTDEQKKAIQDKIAENPDDEYKDAEPTCQATGSKVRYCSVCKTVYVETLPKLDHNWVDIEATCETEGLKNGICGNEGCNEKNPAATEVIPKVPHEAAEDAEVKTTDTKPAKCTEAGERVVETSECKFCHKAFSITSVVPATGHTPGDDVVEDETQHVDPTCDKPGKQVLTGTCEVCGERIAASEFEIPPLGHKFGEWTKTSDGGQERTCEVCKLVQKENANGEIVNPGDEPEEPTPPDDTPDPDAVYTISLSSNISNGSVRRSVSSAKAGETITLTSYANAGYELNSISVLDRSGNSIALTASGGNTHTFTMPAARVTVYASFTSAYSNPTTGSGSAASSSNGNNSSSSSSGSGIPVNRTVPRAAASGTVFYDIPSNHWASGEIVWAYQNGFMSGTGTGGFNPDGTFTYQQMWMVLARLTGSHPANMAEAKQWATRNGFAEGANPTVPVTRQQLVTALYRCAALLGRSTASHGSLAGYKDSKTVPNAARNAMSWAITNGIISGTSDGRLNPGGTTTRAQFAVILYRYYRQIM